MNSYFEVRIGFEENENESATELLKVGAFSINTILYRISNEILMYRQGALTLQDINFILTKLNNEKKFIKKKLKRLNSSAIENLSKNFDNIEEAEEELKSIKSEIYFTLLMKEWINEGFEVVYSFN